MEPKSALCAIKLLNLLKANEYPNDMEAKNKTTKTFQKKKTTYYMIIIVEDLLHLKNSFNVPVTAKRLIDLHYVISNLYLCF